MASHLLLAALIFAAFAAFVEAADLSNYLAACAVPCVNQTLKSTGLCNGLGDNKCLCANSDKLLSSSQKCIASKCQSSRPSETSQAKQQWNKYCSDVGTPVAPSLSTGAKAGIGVGAGIGGLAIIAVIVFLLFRRRQRKKNASRNDAEVISPPDEAYPKEGPDSTPGNNHNTQPKSPAELPDTGTLLVKAPPVRPGHDAMPSELSADAEIP
ncbi:hypothetical protein F4861DRAFT_315559 [Xylaria intraflava]|nr:hypothetical protein F4861DRAFT_315559 [Xylaria intraflava]